MRLLPELRRLRVLGAILLLAAWAVSPSLFLLKGLVGQAKESAPAQSTLIEVPAQGMEMCEHHRHGCPKDCFCPKIAPGEGPARASTVVSGALYEPSLSQCSDETAALHSPPVVVAFLIAVAEPSILCLEIGRCPLPPQPALLYTPQEPPQKVPIA